LENEIDFNLKNSIYDRYIDENTLYDEILNNYKSEISRLDYQPIYPDHFLSKYFESKTNKIYEYLLEIVKLNINIFNLKQEISMLEEIIKDLIKENGL
jgi:hypothetical protein